MHIHGMPELKKARLILSKKLTQSAKGKTQTLKWGVQCIYGLSSSQSFLSYSWNDWMNLCCLQCHGPGKDHLFRLNSWMDWRSKRQASCHCAARVVGNYRGDQEAGSVHKRRDWLSSIGAWSLQVDYFPTSTKKTRITLLKGYSNITDKICSLLSCLHIYKLERTIERICSAEVMSLVSKYCCQSSNLADCNSNLAEGKWASMERRQAM